MSGLTLRLTLVSVLTISNQIYAQFNAAESEVEQFIRESESQLLSLQQAAKVAQWNYRTNITEGTEAEKLKRDKKLSRQKLMLAKEARRFNKTQINDKDLLRKLNLLSILGEEILPQDKLDEYNKLKTDLLALYTKARVSKYKDPTGTLLKISPDVTKIFRESRNARELEHYWRETRDATGRKIRREYLRLIKLRNEAARLNGYTDGSDMLTSPYESKSFKEEIRQTWQGLKPLYQQMHAYVRFKLQEIYPNETISQDGAIPGHLLGQVMALSWQSHFKELTPFPQKPSINLTEAMLANDWTVKTMFQRADEFFQSLGMEPMTELFWNNSLFEQPADREVVCHATATDMFAKDDYRVKMCTKITGSDFITVNHEMGHIQYFMSYHNLSYLYREGPNPGYHEGVADILSLATGTPVHFKRLGLLGDSVDVTDEETNLNALMQTALFKVVFMPFAYVVDLFRWDLYQGKVDESQINCHWVKLRAKIQGVLPPVPRSEEDFDLATLWHVPADYTYIRYFTAFIYEFQFFKALCIEAGEYDPDEPEAKPLHQCKFYGSKAAGRKLTSMLELGNSVSWHNARERMTGNAGMDSSAYREYFKPLENWLVKENKKNGVEVGWILDDVEEKYCLPVKD